MKGDRYRLENWEVFYHPIGVGTYLTGKVYGHYRFDNGEQIHTSTVVGAEGELVVTRTGSRVELGEPHPDYEKQYPGAKQRVLDEGRKHQLEGERA